MLLKSLPNSSLLYPSPARTKPCVLLQPCMIRAMRCASLSTRMPPRCMGGRAAPLAEAMGGAAPAARRGPGPRALRWFAKENGGYRSSSESDDCAVACLGCMQQVWESKGGGDGGGGEWAVESREMVEGAQPRRKRHAQTRGHSPERCRRAAVRVPGTLHLFLAERRLLLPPVVVLQVLQVLAVVPVAAIAPLLLLLSLGAL